MAFSSPKRGALMICHHEGARASTQRASRPSATEESAVSLGVPRAEPKSRSLTGFIAGDTDNFVPSPGTRTNFPTYPAFRLRLRAVLNCASPSPPSERRTGSPGPPASGAGPLQVRFTVTEKLASLTQTLTVPEALPQLGKRPNAAIISLIHARKAFYPLYYCSLRSPG